MRDIKTVDFSYRHVTAASILAAENYRRERSYVSALPDIDALPDLSYFCENGFGAAALENDVLVGFLCCYPPRENFFGTSATGIFSPVHAHGAKAPERGIIYKRLYQHLAERLTAAGVTYHCIANYTHDSEAIDSFFCYGFGMRCVDAIRPMECIFTDGYVNEHNDNIRFRELPAGDISSLDGLRRMLSEHLGQSPCFMYSSEEEYKAWLKRASQRDSRLFTASENDKIIAFTEITSDGENFATEASDMLNICGAYCLPEYRGKGIFQRLLDFTITKLKSEGYVRLGVDYESINPTANAFWSKYFTPYTYSITRRIDEGVLRKYGRSIK